MQAAIDFEHALIKPVPTAVRSRKNVELTREFHGKNMSFTGVPIIAANMDNIGTQTVANILTKHKWFTAINTHEDQDKIKDDHYLFGTFGLNDREKIFQIPSDQPVKLCLDVANGYMVDFVDLVYEVVNYFDSCFVIAGNVATPEGVQALFNAGAHAVKVGIGSGGVCTTRLKAGVGVPQLAAILDCSSVKPQNRYIVSDGGCRNPGDIAKAFVAGADFVMIGSMLAGHDETGTEFYGSSSWKAMKNKGIDKDQVSYRTEEGKEAEVKSKGPLKNTILDIEGGIRSACAYTNCLNIMDLKRADLIMVHRQVNHI